MPKRMKQSGSLRMIVLMILFSSFVFPIIAEPPVWWQEVHDYDANKPWYSYYKYTTSYFGPNALPVPEIADGLIADRHSAEISTDIFWGYGDRTQSLSTRLTYAFIPGRLAISGWGVLAEHYNVTTEVRDLRASMDKDTKGSLIIGDLYFSTIIGLFREKKIMPDLSLEVVLKTAASGNPNNSRYVDTPGYYFDVNAGKSIFFKHSYFKELRLVGMAGFLCYQLNSHHQNDAPLFGGKVMLKARKWAWENSISGYSGWTGLGDKPLVLRSRLKLDADNFCTFIQYQHSLRDYPFRRLQTGVAFKF